MSMKRFNILSAIILLSGFLIAGYSDSSVNKEVATYQVNVLGHSIATLVKFSTSVDFEFAPVFALDSPELVHANTVIARLSEKSAKGYVAVIRGPPDNRYQKSELLNIKASSLKAAFA